VSGGEDRVGWMEVTVGAGEERLRGDMGSNKVIRLYFY